MKYFKVLLDLYRLKRNAGLSNQKMKALQDKKLRKLLRYAWERSDFYRKSFEAAGITREQLEVLPLSCFPSIDKLVLLENFDQIVTCADLKQDDLRAFDAREEVNRKPYLDRYHVVHSSGSTGKPGYFVYDEEAWHTMLLGIIRAALWKMSMPEIIRLVTGRPRIAYIAATDGRYAGAMAVGDGIDGIGASQMYLDIKLPLAQWISQIREFRPNIIIGYPSAIKILAEMVHKGTINVDVCRVISCGEPLGLGLRSYLEQVFGAPVINIYGASESLSLGVETDAEEGMLLFDDMNVIEVENGVMYLTSLYNYAQPLIRYRLSDRLSLRAAEENSACPFTRAVGLVGRNEDILWFEDGDGNREFLHPLAIEGFCIEGLKDYQFRQTSKEAFEMAAEISASASREYIRESILEQMKAILAEKNLHYVQFYVIFVDEVQPDLHTGKKQLILRTALEE